MGLVYLAERADGEYRKQVAVKLIRSGFGLAEVRDRFRNERQILAALEHPNIARLLDGGMTDEGLGVGHAGLPYLVMEYVEGEPLDRYCDREELSIQGRVRLFCSVCAAVEYAHQHHVVHRDLKPSNILVAERRGSTGPEPTVKLLDFGIAKLLDESAIDGSAAHRTRTGVRLMTPEYASPEQIRGERVSPASDVYALGVVLYELLTGRRPYALEARTRRRCSGRSSRPSRRGRARRCPGAAVHAGDGDAPPSDPRTPSDRRGLTVREHRRLLLGDLDAVVLRALRKEPERRYASVEALRQDLERYLEGRPVSASTGASADRARRRGGHPEAGAAEADGAGPRRELRERLQATLGGAYTLERELGGGGMSRVFVAEDSDSAAAWS
jgi:serine/threonine protein kinase